MNLTITIDDEILERARLRAIEEDTSAKAVVRSFLEAYAGGAQRREPRGQSLDRFRGG